MSKRATRVLRVRKLTVIDWRERTEAGACEEARDFYMVSRDEQILYLIVQITILSSIFIYIKCLK